MGGWLRTRNKTHTAGERNRGILETTGQYIAFLDADDYWTPEKLEKQTSLMNSDEGLGLSYHRYYYVNPSRNRTGDGPHADYHDYYTLLTECTISASTVMLRKEQLASTGIFDTSLRIGEDWSLWLMFARMSRLVGIDGEMAVYRIHAASATSDNKILYCGAIHMLCNKMRDAIRDRDKKAVKYIKSGMRKYRRIYAANEFDKARSYMSNKDIQMTIRKVLISLWNDPLFTLGSIWKWVVKRKIGASYNGNV